MLKKPITYTNFDNEEITEEHWFNLTMAECVELQLAYPGGFEAHVTEIMTTPEGAEMSTEQAAQLMWIMKDLIKRSYGVRVGSSFVKSKEDSEVFVSTEAYSVLFMELVTDGPKSAEFVNSVMPKDLIAKANAQIRMGGQTPKLTIVDEAEDVFRPSHLDRKLNALEGDGKKVKIRTPGLMTKEEIISKMKAKMLADTVLTLEQVKSMTQGELDDALEAGATIEGL